MALKFKRGDKVRQIVKPIEGQVVSSRVIDDDVQFEVAWKDPADKEGKHIHSRFFNGDELEKMESEEVMEVAPATATTSAAVKK